MVPSIPTELTLCAPALIHGYDYRLIHAPRYWFRHQTWVKVPMMREALKSYKFVVFLDSDAIFVEPLVPLEWLMDLWGVKDETTLAAMAIDLDEPSNYDSRGNIMWNTGFVITQQSQRTEDMFDSWVNCPTDEKYPGCSHWEYSWAHEQAAFAEYIRYEYNETDELVPIPSNDANGSPYIPQNATCGGAFVSHYWHSKNQSIADLHELVAGGLSHELEDGRGGDLIFKTFLDEHPFQR
jgi:nucleotide-diphospho-sugar transferase